MNQPRLLFPTDGFDADAGGAQDAIDQYISVGGLSHGAGGNGAYLGHFQIGGNPLEMMKGVHGLLDGDFPQTTGPKGIRAEPHRQADVFQRLHLALLIEPSHYHSNAVRTDIDRGDGLHHAFIVPPKAIFVQSQ